MNHNQHSLIQHHPAAMAAAAAASLVAANAFGDSGNSIGSWTSPETNTSTRSGWNADGSMKSDGVPDDGTAIWGNPSTKKTGIDWTEKESLLNPPNNNSEKRIQKSEPIISSINGTEAWGAPAVTSSGASKLSNSNNSQQLANSNENSGNNFVGKTTINNEPLSWADSSSLQQVVTKNRNPSPPKDSVWNYMNSNEDSESKRKPSSGDWLSSSASSNNSISRLDDLSKQLEATSLFNGNTSASTASLLTKNSSSSANNNPNLDNNNVRQSSSMLGNSNSAGTIGAGLTGGVSSNAINDLKQMSANFSSDLLESSPIRHQQQQQTNSILMPTNNQSQSQLGPYSLGVTPSRELLKQMVHQIQLAVQAGHLNAHILNQPLSTPTLQLVYTLLQQIKLLQQFQEIQHRSQSANKSGEMNAQQSNLELQITRVQQNISLLQRAITQQQAALTKNESLVESSLKQQQQQQQATVAAAANNPSYNSSYANISKLSTNMKVPSNTSNMSSTIGGNSIDSFRRTNFIDTLSNSNSDRMRSAAQNSFESNTNIDKNLSPLLQSSASLNNILNNKQQHDYTKQQNFTNNHNANQQAKVNMLSSTAQASTSPAAAAWYAFTHGGDLANMQSGSVGSGWSKLSAQEQPQYNSDLLSELSAKAWRGASFLRSDVGDNASSNQQSSASSSMAPGPNIARPNSATSNLKQISENDILNKDQSLFYDWTSSSQASDSIKRNFDAATSSSFSSAIGGLSLQSNPWLFSPTSSNSLNIGLDNIIGGNKLSAKNNSDNGNTDKTRVDADSIGFLSSNNNTGNNAQRAMYDWGEIASAGASSLHYNNDNNSVGSNKQTATSGSAIGARPAPPPGLISNLGQLGNSSVSDISSLLDSEGNKQVINNFETQQMPSRESSSSLWSAAWFD